MQVLTELLNNAPAAEEPRHNAVPVA
jgi:hypothetical protein